MAKIVLNEIEYELVRNEKDGFSYDEVHEKCTDYFVPFDYIFGDYAYDKLRLKGFYEETHPSAKEINDIKQLDSYIHDHCAYGARYFLLKKVK